MDLHKLFFKRPQRANMSSNIPHPCGKDFFNPLLNFGNQSSTFQSFGKDCGNSMPYKSFSYPNCYNFNVSPETVINKAMDFSTGFETLKNIPTQAMSLTCFVGGILDSKQGMWSQSERKASNCSNPFENMLNDIITKSMELTRTMSCPDAFSFNDFTPATNNRFSSKSAQAEKPPVNNKMSYADVAKMNLSNPKKNNSYPVRPAFDISSSQKHFNFPNKKECKVISPPHPFNNSLVNKNNNNRKSGTNNTNKMENANGTKLKYQPFCKSSNTRKPQNKKMQGSLKRELGTKKNNQKVDFDGSIWSRDNYMEGFEDCPTCSPSNPFVVLRVRSISSDSDCSSELSECLKNSRVRTLSECSVNSVDSDDSFIIFDDCTGDEIYDDESSSDGDDECLTVVDSCNGLPQADYLHCANSKWASLPLKKIPDQKKSLEVKPVCSFSPCSALKKVRFACGEALAKVRKLCVWDFAHRAARIGPWEQAARDRARFSSRIATLAPVLNLVLDPAHRSRMYNQRFSGS